MIDYTSKTLSLLSKTSSGKFTSASSYDISLDESNFNLLTVYFNLLLAFEGSNVTFRV